MENIIVGCVRIQDELSAKLESILFSSGRRMKLEELAKLCNATQETVKKALVELKNHYEEKNSSLMFVEEGDSWKLTVREKFLPIVQKIVTETELPKSVIETLSVVAFKHPILQSEVVKIRSNKAYEHLDELERAGYITREKHGRTKKIKLAQKFFEYFDLPPDKVRDAFAGFEVVEKAIAEKEKELLRKESKKETLGPLEVYEAKEAEQEGMDVLGETEDTTSEVVPTEKSDETPEPKEMESPEQEEAEEPEQSEELIGEEFMEESGPPSGVNVFIKKKEVQKQEAAPEESEEEEHEEKHEEESPENLIDDIIEKKANAIFHPPKEEKPKEQKKDLLDEIYSDVEEDKKELERKDGF